jgi:hypothetical protein
MRTSILLTLVVAGVVGCADHAYDPEAPAIDPNAPRVHIIAPVRGTIAGDVRTVTVTGTASDDSGNVAGVTVNDVPARIAPDGSWRVDVVVAPGTSLLHAVATDAQGNQASETRAVVTGPTAPLAQHVPDAIRATLSAQALAALGTGTATFIENGGLMSAVQGHNPVVDVGGGPDCLYAQASITSITVGDADVQMVATIGGVNIASTLTNVRVGLHLQWAAACIDGSTDAVVTAQRVAMQGKLTIGVVDRKLAVHVATPAVQVTGLDLQLPGVPDTIVQMLALDTTLGPVLGAAVQTLAVPMVEQQLASLDDTRTIDVAGAQVELDVEPTQATFTPDGGLVWLDTSLRAQGDHGDYVYVPNIAPPLDASAGFQLAVADDAANQLLTSMWSAKALDQTVALDPAADGRIGELYRTVQLQAMVPPHVDASGDQLHLTIGDWIATFAIGNYTTIVAIHATSDLYVVKGDTTALRADLGTPTVYVDVVDDAGTSDPITRVQYNAIKAWAVARITAFGSAAVAALPLPAIGDAMPANLWIQPEHGYLVIAGDVR